MGARRKARECAVQMLFAIDVTEMSVEELVRLFWSDLNDAEIDEPSREFATTLVRGTRARLAQIDKIIVARAEHWRISRMAIVDRNILRLAVNEFLFENTPRTVVINEALEVARRFSTYEATQFINGILDAVKHDLEGKNGKETILTSDADESEKSKTSSV